MAIFINQLLLGELQGINIKVKRVAYAELDSLWCHKPQIITNNMFYLITEGEGDIWLNGQHHHMTAGNIYFLPKGCERAYQCPQSMNKLYFYVNLFNSKGEEIPITPNEGVVLTDRGETIREMLSLYQKNDYHSALSLRLYIEQIVLEVLARFPNERTIHNYSPLISNCLRIITQAPHLSLSAAVLAERTLTSVSLLRQHFKKEMGVPIGKFVQDQVLSAAAYDLQTTDLTLQEISAKYGFCDQFYFSRLFTSRFGISPSRYRKN